MKKILLALICAATALTATPQLHAASIIFDDFNVNEGHFAGLPSTSGSGANVAASSTADRVLTNSPVEGVGHQRLVFNPTTVGSAFRTRFLSGGGTPANNTVFATSAAEDGWIGLYVKTTEPGWTVQIWIEGPSNNGSVPKSVIADGDWHLYEWNLDDDSGSADGWGPIPGVFSSLPPQVLNGNHTIDSILFRHSTTPTTSTLFMDFIAKTSSDSVSNLLNNPCLLTSGVLVIGPVSTNSPDVTVSGVSASATEVKVYQNSGVDGAMVQIGSKTTGITAGNNAVTVSGLVKAAQVVATQTVGGQESCVPAPANGAMVGGGANPSVRIALSIRETPSTGPVGVPGDNSYTNIYFLNASAVTSGSPIDADVVYPSNGWQTVTFLRGTNEIVGDATTAAGATADGTGYLANESVSVQVYAYRVLPNNVTIFSSTPTASETVTSNDVFTVNWTWQPVIDATGYRLLRNYNFNGYTEYLDVTGTSLADTNTSWTAGSTVTPTSSQPGRSVKWNTTTGDPYPIGTTNYVPGQWGILESIALAIHNLDDTGPFDLYIDNIQNGTTVFQTFESAPANASDYGFRSPSFSSSTSGNILTTPDVGQIVNQVADTGTKSFHTRFQWSGTNTTKWLRLTTSGVNNPLVNLDEPISFRLLLQPINTPLPAAPPAPALNVAQVGANIVLSWTDGHRLQTSVNATGTYTNVPQTISANNWTNISSGAFLGPWTNTFTDPTRFFRLAD